jgi:hypothetical protein
MCHGMVVFNYDICVQILYDELMFKILVWQTATTGPDTRRTFRCLYMGFATTSNAGPLAVKDGQVQRSSPALCQHPLTAMEARMVEEIARKAGDIARMAGEIVRMAGEVARMALDEHISGTPSDLDVH